MESCVFAGTFDPVTKGHENVINKCIKKYRKVFVVVGINDKKQSFFSEEERLFFLKELYKEQKKVEVLAYSKLKDNYAEFLKENQVSVYVRGIRNEKDLEYENSQIEKNKKLYPFIKTEYIKVKKLNEISSSFVKELILTGKDFSEFVPKKCLEIILNAVNSRK